MSGGGECRILVVTFPKFQTISPLRLHQQILQINRFLNGAAEANYSCIIWMADPDSLNGAHGDYSTLAIDLGADYTSTPATKEITRERDQWQYLSFPDKQGLSDFDSPHTLVIYSVYWLSKVPNGPT